MKRIVLLLILSMFVLAGCEKNLPADENQVLIYLSTGSLANQETKSTTADAEKLISKIVLYGVDDKNAVVKTFTVPNPTLTGFKLTIPVQVKTLYAIANPTADIENAATPLNVAAILNLTADFTEAPQSPYIMSGIGAVSGSNANIELIRAIAKVEISPQNEFLIESVTVKNTPDKGFVFKKESTAAPTTSSRVSYPANTSNSTVYVAENSKDNPTEFEITGTYLGKQAIYTIVLSKDNTPIDIVRNTYYKVSVSALTDKECTITITIPAWEGVITTDEHIIPDTNFES